MDEPVSTRSFDNLIAIYRAGATLSNAHLIGIDVTCENFSGKLGFVAVFDP